MRAKPASIVKNPAELVAVGVAAAFLVGAVLAADLGGTADDPGGFGSVAQEPSHRRDLVTAYVGGRASARTIPPSEDPSPASTAPPSDVVEWPVVTQPELSPWITVADPENTTSPDGPGGGTTRGQSPTTSAPPSATSPGSPATPAPSPSATSPAATPTATATATRTESEAPPPTTSAPDPTPTSTSTADAVDSSAPADEPAGSDVAAGPRANHPAMVLSQAEPEARPAADSQPAPESTLD